MKKLLLGTTALIGAAAIATAASAAPAEALTVTVGGYMQFDAGFVSEDEATTQHFRGHDFRTSTEVHVKAEGTTDNGLTYGAVIELEGDNESTDNGDDNFIYVSGGWGKFEFGDNDGVADSGGSGLSITAPGAWGLGGAVADQESYRDFITNTRSTMFADGEFSDIGFLGSLYESINSGDATKITYYTPVWNGFQAGLSYAPDFANAGVDTTRDEAAVDGTPLYEADVNQILELAARYNYDFGNDIGLGVSGTYVSSGSDETTAGVEFVEDITSWTLGAQVTWGGFTLGGSYTDAGDSFADLGNTAVNGFDDTEAYTVGLQYETGPFVFGVNYLNAQAEGDDATTDADSLQYDATSVGVTYAAAPGWVAYAEATSFDLEDEADATITGDNDGSVVILGTRVSF